MSQEVNMRVYIAESRYDSMNSIVDVSNIAFINSRNPLYIGAKEGQVSRMKNNIHQEKLDGMSVGFWELHQKPGYVTKKGKIQIELFRGHDVIFFADPNRVHEKFREAYKLLIKTVTEQL